MIKMSYTFRQNLVNSSKYSIKCPYTMDAQYITIHNTSNSASADAEIRYMINNDNQTSYHVCVDEKEVIQAIPFNRNAWHAGDGGSGTGNRKSIGIEIARSTGDLNLFKQAEQNCAEYVAKLLKERGWGVDRVKRHKDWSGKYCPHKTMDLGWERFLNMIKTELNKLNGNTTNTASTANVVKVKTVKGEWKIKVLQDTNLWNDTSYKTVGGHVKKGQVLYVTEITKDYNFFVYQGKYLVNSYKLNYVTNEWLKPQGKIQIKQDCNAWSYANYNVVVGQVKAWEIFEYSEKRNDMYHIPYIGWVSSTFVNKELKLTDALVTN